MGQTAVSTPLIKEVDLEKQNKTSTTKYQIFCCLWAIATLFHMANHRSFDDQLHFVALSMGAIFLLAKPSSVFRMLLLIALQLFDVIKSMPGVSNHWIFTCFVNLTIVAALIYLVAKKRSFQINKGEWYEIFAPVVRILVIILYFFVVFHKLNAGFFSVEASCATDLYISQNAYGVLPETPLFLSLSAWFTIFMEALIPIMLCFRVTRNWGILIGLIFHNIIAFNPYNGFYDFSSMIYAVYFFFADDYFTKLVSSVYTKIVDFKIRLRAEFSQQFSFKRLIVLMIIFGCGMVVLFVLTKRFEDFFRYIFWGIYSLAFISLMIFAILKKKQTTATKEGSPAFALPHLAFILIPIIVFLNGSSPYLGLKTENSFAMFSNLRTEGGETNHYIIPASSQIFSFQDELVEVIASSDHQLQSIADSHKLLVFYEFKHLVSQIRPEKVEYIRNGKAETFDLYTAMSSKHELLNQNPFFIRKLFRFRSISKGDPQPCVH